MTKDQAELIYHLVPAGYYQAQPKAHPYLPETFAQEGFIHCTAGLDVLIEIANTYFDTLPENLLVLKIDPQQLTAPLKFEPPIPPPGQTTAGKSDSLSDLQPLFPHIYGPLNREAIINTFTLDRDNTGRWQLPRE